MATEKVSGKKDLPKNAAYSMQYARITSQELKDVLDKRE
jgi:hypothetical protein